LLAAFSKQLALRYGSRDGEDSWGRAG
jgi:hypothetical protein